jgi:hypothetical protein
MAMTYSSLTGAKGTPGAVATWSNYTKLDIPTIVDEAQALIYSAIRTREMTATYNFSMGIGGANFPLPAYFLDPIGRINFTSFNSPARHKDGAFVQRNRNYTELSGTLGTNPFTTTTGSNIVSVNLAGNGFSQDSIFNTSGATAFNGATINGTFPVTAITDANDFTIDITSLGTTPTGSGAGGGAAVNYLCDNLIQGFPDWFGIWNETVYFDTAFTQQTLGVMQYYRSLPLLSASNESNFLTNRYPQLMRTSCQAAAADFMKDNVEYQKCVQRLQGLVQQISIENDGYMRGMEIDTYTP